jgi:hypothetical protein
VVPVARDQHHEVVRIPDQPVVGEPVAATPSALDVVATVLPELGEMIVDDDRAMLLSSGERMPPWGVPVTVSLATPSSERTPALRNALIRPTTRLSPTRFRTRLISAECEIRSKHASMSPSNTHSYERDAR